MEATIATPAPLPSREPALAAVRDFVASQENWSRATVDLYEQILDCLEADVPEWLASFSPPPPIVGRDYAPINLFQCYWFDETPAEVFESLKRAWAILRDFACSEHLPRLSAGTTPEGFIPYGPDLRPRLGFHHEGAADSLQQSAAPGEHVYKCAISGCLFAVPAGAPVPCVYFDCLYLDDELNPDDRNPQAMTIHPAIAAQGPAAVLAAMWGELRGKFMGLANSLEALLSRATLLAGVSPEEIGGETMPDALTSWKADGEGSFKRVPAGWRHVDRV